MPPTTTTAAAAAGPLAKKVKAEAGGEEGSPLPAAQAAAGVVNPAAAGKHHTHRGAHAAPVSALQSEAPRAKDEAPPPPLQADAPSPPALDRPLGADLHTTSPHGARGSRGAATILERGRIVFLARPALAAEAAHHIAAIDQVRTFYMALVPAAEEEGKAGDTHKDKVEAGQAAAAAGEEKEEEQEHPAHAEPAPAAWAPRARLIIIGKKHLPTKGERFWGFVQAVGDTFADLFKAAKTKGEGEGGGAGGSGGGGTKKRKARAAPPAPDDDTRLRVLAEGDYALTRVGHVAATGHLTYVLAEPHMAAEGGGGGFAPGLEEVSISPAGRFLINIKNPVAPNRGGGGLSPAAKARFPPDALAAFAGKTSRTAGHGLAWVNAAAHPSLLSTRHAEVLVIGANPPEVSDPALADSLAAAAEADHEAHLRAGGGGGAGAGAEADQYAAEEAAVRVALEAELQAAALHLDVVPAVTGELD